MKTRYEDHDGAYKKRKAKGEQGWATPEMLEDYLAIMEKALRAEYVPKRGKLLELGCGDGANLLWLAEKGYEAYGVDISPTAIEWAREKAGERNIKADLQTGNVLNLKGYEDGFFDFVLDGHCLHCIIGEDRAKFLSSARRVLKPKGFFHVCTMCGEVASAELQKVFDPGSRCLVYNGIATRYVGLAEEILAEIKEAGFSVLDWEVIPAKDRDDMDDLVVAATV